MKIVVCVALLIIVSYNAEAQSESYIFYKDKLATRDSLIYASEVIAVDSTTAQQLYYRSKNWFYDNFKSGKDVIKLDIEANNEISGRGFFDTELIMNRPTSLGRDRFTTQIKNIYFTVKIQCKDNHYRYELSNFKTLATSYGDYTGTVETPIERMRPHILSKILTEDDSYLDLEKYYGKIAAEVKSIIASVKKTMNTKSEW